MSDASHAPERVKRLALLIDADNAQPCVMGALLAEVAGLGEVILRRIYGDFTSQASAGWKGVLNEHSISPVQQFAYTTGKNATDSAMIIDAMDLLYTHRFDGFCLVSSDSDFTGLARRLREEGLLVYGFGEKKTPEAFRKACNRFVFTEVLRGTEAPPAPAPKKGAKSAASAARKAKAPATPRHAAAADLQGKTPPAAPPAKPLTGTATRKPAGAKGARQAAPAPAAPAAAAVPQVEVERIMAEALTRSDDEEGWLDLGALGSYVQQIQPDFDPRLYGHRKLSDLLRSRPDLFEVREAAVPGSTGKVLYARLVAR